VETAVHKSGIQEGLVLVNAIVFSSLPVSCF